MTLERLTARDLQARSLFKIDRLTAQLEEFLLAGKAKGLSPSTLKGYRYECGVFVRFCLSELRVNDAQNITATHVRFFLVKLQETNKAISVNDYSKAIRRFFNWLIEEEIITQSPMRNIKAPRLPRILIKPFSLDDITKLLYLCSGKKFLNYRNRAMVLIFLDTGLRLSELANIKIQDMKNDGEIIKVMGKGAKERIVRLGLTAQKALLRYYLMRESQYDSLWLTEEGKPLSKEGVRVAMRNLCLRAGITDAKPGPHSFRHTFATRALLNGAGEFQVQSLLGHEDLRMTRRYAATINSEHAVKAHEKFSPVDRLLK